MKPAAEHRTVSRIVGILEAVAVGQDGMRLTTLAETLGAPKSSIFGLVKGLVATGYLADNNGTYMLGPALGSLIRTQAPTLVDAARPSLVSLRDEFNETAIVSTLVGESVVYVDAVESRHVIRYNAQLHVRRPLYPTSTGKVFLSWLSEPRREAYLKAHIDDDSLRATARQELEKVQEEGVAFNRGETLPDVSAAARPVVVGDRIVAAISIGGPTWRTSARLQEMSTSLITATAAISERLAGKRPMSGPPRPRGGP